VSEAHTTAPGLSGYRRICPSDSRGPAMSA
jgi:hypothetical protein